MLLAVHSKQPITARPFDFAFVYDCDTNTWSHVKLHPFVDSHAERSFALEYDRRQQSILNSLYSLLDSEGNRLLLLMFIDRSTLCRTLLDRCEQSQRCYRQQRKQHYALLQ